MATGTAYNPQNINEFEKSKLNKDARGVSATITAGTTQDLDLTLSDDVLMSGGAVFLAKGAAQGDYVQFQVLQGTTIASQFITDWYLNPDVTLQQIPTSNYPAKLVAGLTLRLKYTSTGSTDVWIAVNYNLEKVLV